MSEERQQILDMLQAGQINTEQALTLLDALDETASDEVTGFDAEMSGPGTDPAPMSNAWLYPTIAGSIVMAVGAPLLALGLSGRAALFWAICFGWVPFLIGLTLLSIGVWSRNARWFHLRIQSAGEGRRPFSLSLPLPLTLVAWLLRIAQPFVPQLKDTGLDEVILSLRDASQMDSDQPFFVDVQDGPNGERVLIWFG
jgi:hypothetical protein